MKYMVKAMHFMGIRKSSDTSLNSRSIHICSTLFYMLITIFNAISNITYSFVYDVDLAIVSETQYTVGTFMKGFSMLFAHFIFKDRIYNLIDEMEKMKLNRRHLIESGNDNSKTAYHESKTLTKCMVIANGITMVTLVCMPITQGLITQNFHLPLMGWLPFDSTHGFNYAIAYLFQALGLITASLHITLFEVFFISIMIRLSSEFKNLYNNFLKLVEPNNIELCRERKTGCQNKISLSRSQTLEAKKEKSLKNVATKQSSNAGQSSGEFLTVDSAHVNQEYTPKEKSNLGTEADDAHIPYEEYDNRLAKCIIYHQNVLE